MYQEGMALVRLVNNLNDSQPVFYHQRSLRPSLNQLPLQYPQEENSSHVHRLDAGMSIMYAWDCPQAKRELIFYCNETDNRHSNKLTYDSIEEFKVNNTKAYLVSFMWNMQRVLLFTQNASVAKNARLSSDLEPIDQEIVISLQSIGISLVDNHSRAELAYVSITRLVLSLIFIDFFCFYQLLVSSHKLIPRCNLSNTCTHTHFHYVEISGKLSIQNLVEYFFKKESE
ncbi:unnamed protein product [Schistosoma curassoni]|uniref:Myotubularin phosphatase domain-containing protein n=1 Tax=Schistosoma curassoni TaxID=6186 RepID=A0A183JZA8_9TREM|nr:unnamed protein product [Schistosoma curassoni]